METASKPLQNDQALDLDIRAQLKDFNGDLNYDNAKSKEHAQAISYVTNENVNRELQARGFETKTSLSPESNSTYTTVTGYDADGEPVTVSVRTSDHSQPQSGRQKSDHTIEIDLTKIGDKQDVLTNTERALTAVEKYFQENRLSKTEDADGQGLVDRESVATHNVPTPTESDQSPIGKDKIKEASEKVNPSQKVTTKEESGNIPSQGVDPNDIPANLVRAAYQWNSLTDSTKHIERERKEYVQEITGLREKFSPLAQTDEQRQILDAEIERYREGYLKRTKDILSAKSRTASPMVTGPANFPVERNRKALDAEQAVEFIATHSGFHADELRRSQAARETAFRKAAMKLHPDKGGSAVEFAKLTDARRFLEQL